MRQRSRPRSERGAWWDGDRHPGRVHDLTVYDSGPIWRSSGILDADGQMIEHYAGPEPIGFLRRRDDGSRDV